MKIEYRNGAGMGFNPQAGEGVFVTTETEQDLILLDDIRILDILYGSRNETLNMKEGRVFIPAFFGARHGKYPGCGPRNPAYQWIIGEASSTLRPSQMTWEDFSRKFCEDTALGKNMIFSRYDHFYHGGAWTNYGIEKTSCGKFFAYRKYDIPTPKKDGPQEDTWHEALRRLLTA